MADFLSFFLSILSPINHDYNDRGGGIYAVRNCIYGKIIKVEYSKNNKLKIYI